MKQFFLSCFLVFVTKFLFAQSYQLSGTITSAEVGTPLKGASISIRALSKSALSDEKGYYEIEDLPAGELILVVSYVGYELFERSFRISPDKQNVADISLSKIFRLSDEVTVTTSRRPEKITDAPASIQVVSRRELEQFTGSNSFELLSKVQGLEFVRTGADHISVNARGLNNAFNGKVLQLVDNRNSMAALSGNLPLHNNFSVVKDDIEKIEVVLGPQTALYGPNAHNAIINFITRDPRTSQGTMAAISAGNQSRISARLRHAQKIDQQWAFKVTGEYMKGEEFEFYDSIYAGGGPGGVYGPPVAIPEKITTFDFSRYRGEAHVYFSPRQGIDLIVSGGGSKTNGFNTTTAGHNYFRDMRNSFVQARMVSKRFFLNAYHAWANFGTTYSIGTYTRDFWNRTHSSATTGPNRRLTPDSAELFALRPFKETPRKFNAEAQYNNTIRSLGLIVVSGLSYQYEMPNAHGISLVDSFHKIRVSQLGAVVQLEKSIPKGIRLIGAVRVDHHSNFGNFVAPKFALVKKIGDGNARITWGRAYSAPSILYQYASTGGSFFGNGGGITYIPNLTKMSDSVRKVTSRLKPEEVRTWEIGYKGNPAKKYFVDVSAYYGLNKNFFSPSISVGGRALKVGDIRVTHNPNVDGDIINDTLKNASFSTIFNFGDVKVYGIDAGITYTVNRHANISLKYSWMGSDIGEGKPENDANKDGYVSNDEKSLNAPAHRASASLSLLDMFKKKFFANIGLRYVSEYDFYSGSQISTAEGAGKRGRVYAGLNANSQPRYYLKGFDQGALGGFTTVDLGAGYRLNPTVSIAGNVQNLFNTKQREFPGSPLITRLFMFELKVQVP